MLARFGVATESETGQGCRCSFHCYAVCDGSGRDPRKDPVTRLMGCRTEDGEMDLLILQHAAAEIAGALLASAAPRLANQAMMRQ